MTITADTILAIDLGRFKSVACVYSHSSRNHAFRTIDSKPDALALPMLLGEHLGAGCMGPKGNVRSFRSHFGQNFNFVPIGTHYEAVSP